MEQEIAGDGLPAHALMGACLPLCRGQHGVQQQDALAHPIGQVVGPLGVGAHVGCAFFKNVAQRRRAPQSWPPHAEGQAMGLALPMVGILPYNHNPDLMR